MFEREIENEVIRFERFIRWENFNTVIIMYIQALL